MMVEFSAFHIAHFFHAFIVQSITVILSLSFCASWVVAGGTKPYLFLAFSDTASEPTGESWCDSNGAGVVRIVGMIQF